MPEKSISELIAELAAILGPRVTVAQPTLLPEPRVGNVTHNHAAHKVRGSDEGKTWCIADCADCQVEHNRNVLLYGVCCPRVHGGTKKSAKRPQCPACYENIP